MQSLRDFRDEWTRPGYAYGVLAAMCKVARTLVAVGAGGVTVALIVGVGDVGLGDVVTLWLYAGGFEIAARLLLVFALREIDAADLGMRARLAPPERTPRRA